RQRPPAIDRDDCDPTGHARFQHHLAPRIDLMPVSLRRGGPLHVELTEGTLIIISTSSLSPFCTESIASINSFARSSVAIWPIKSDNISIYIDNHSINVSTIYSK